jgi:hypothetical protein
MVSAFAVIGSAFKPKTVAGLFGSAPPVALTGLGWSFCKEGHVHVMMLARSMLIGAVSLLIYAAVCVWLTIRQRV